MNLRKNFILHLFALDWQSTSSNYVFITTVLNCTYLRVSMVRNAFTGSGSGGTGSPPAAHNPRFSECGGAVKIIASIEDPVVISKILAFHPDKPPRNRASKPPMIFPHQWRGKLKDVVAICSRENRSLFGLLMSVRTKYIITAAHLPYPENIEGFIFVHRAE